MVEPLKDAFQRKFYYLRLSITDVCNFRCQYCLPDGYQSTPDSRAFLTLPEIERVASAFAACGTNKIRITGGEPTLRRDFTDIVSSVSAISGIEKVAMTTNGYRLAKSAAEWRAAGLTNINVSVDSLDPRLFAQITGENRFQQVMAGIDAAFDAGFEQVKVNAVLLKTWNSQALPQFLNWIRHRPIQLRFIELMQTGEMDAYFAQQHVSGIGIKNILIQQGWTLKPKGQNDGPAQVFQHPDYLGEIGLILPYEQNFCQSCNRLRISAKGKLHLCLFGEDGVDLRDLLQENTQQPALIQRIQSALDNKAESHFLQLGRTGQTPHLASIGG